MDKELLRVVEKREPPRPPKRRAPLLRKEGCFFFRKEGSFFCRVANFELTTAEPQR